MTIPPNPTDGSADPLLWLEQIEGERAVAWVEAQNARTDTALCDDSYRADFDAALAILNADDRIPFVGKSGDWLYNFWKDAAHPRGLWRRTTLDSYRSAAPDWDVLLDIDALNATESVSWAFAGAVRSPDKSRALVSLSFNGTDAVEVREFDLAGKSFVAGGFVLPQAKTQVAWLDRDTILFGSAFGADDTTAAGYARLVRRWRRGTPLAAADTVFAVEPDDVAAWFGVNHRPGHESVSYARALDFTRSQSFIEPRHGAYAGQRIRLELPEEVAFSHEAATLLVSPKQDWAIGGQTIASGALVAIALDRFLAGVRDFEIVFRPEPTRALQSWLETRHGVVLEILDNVRGRVVLASRGEAGWTESAIPGLPDNASIGAQAFGGEDDPDLGTDILLTITSFERPTSTALWTGCGAPQPLKQAPTSFDATGIEVKQCHAVAADGTRIPYFLIGKDLAAKGPRPTILYGYGGFEVSLTPAYLGVTGKLWLERGHLYALANIRGGGEFGPAWHLASRKATKHVAHDDFAAVARDLATSGVTTAQQLACQGGSNGGLLVGNMLTRYPELFGAVWCAVPLLDMARYTKLLAGQSWIAEYGDPDNAEEWDFIRKFSPYHLIEAGRPYPPIFITTNRTDDRVHPGHARKMAARLEQSNYRVWFNETVAGGHSGGVDNLKQAQSQALGFAFLRRTIAVA
ncbi:MULTISPECIES: prolyl oligopeptidase family serine peptidase [Rhodopseudomonas]|uniref:Peptidase S9 n=1 Tax=Rhodopseudomonas palustris TaxID=1076 RepID=A0A0D7EIY4_RHOPL|nr:MULTISPECIES: prolyl oligopeptidase family serine peptidase [Rhodopseudomonas]KIZ40784.1 peptidase S9 [Rhodopseudomonas palustris]WOK20205.1 prolyl oligopeptidase family serine peptidase [Rhodopseudomonas sp. BAL398]